MALNVQRAGPNDQAACAAVFVATVTQTFPDEPPEGRTIAAYAASVAGEEQWMAVLDRRTIAYISVYWKTNFIHSLYVLPEFQGQGVGKALLDTVLCCMRGDAELKTDKGNARAYAFYRHLGWFLSFPKIVIFIM